MCWGSHPLIDISKTSVRRNEVVNPLDFTCAKQSTDWGDRYGNKAVTVDCLAHMKSSGFTTSLLIRMASWKGGVMLAWVLG